MPAIHHIDKKNKLIITTWEGEPTTLDLSDSFKVYQRDIKSKPEFFDYDELVDFSKNECFKLSSDGLRALSNLATSFDESVANSKLAIVVNTILSFGLARMYELYRSLGPKKKEIRVFKNKSSALTWLGYKNDQA